MVNMTGNVQELRPKAGDSEKITINLGYVDLGHIDLLVREGFYSNRTDFIRTAIRNQLDRHGDAVKQSVARHRLIWPAPLQPGGSGDVRARGETLHIQVLGLAVIAPDVSAELARQTIASIRGSRRLASQPRGQGRAAPTHPLNAASADRAALSHRTAAQDQS